MRTSGVVRETFQREWRGRNGDTIMLHSFQLDGDNRYYRTGENNPVSANDSISFEYDDKGNVALDTIETVANPGPASPPQRTQAATGTGFRKGGGGGFKAKMQAKDDYWERKERREIEVVEPRITWASAQSDAVDLVTAALQHDLLTFGNAPKGAKLGLLLDYVDQVTARFAVQRFNSAGRLKDAIAEAEGESNREAAKAGDSDNDLE